MLRGMAPTKPRTSPRPPRAAAATVTAAATATHVALFRGINVGRAKRVSMADLKAMVEALGYRGVRTLLNSGNLVFDVAGRRDDPGARIERGMTERIGVPSRVTLLTAEELAEIVAKNTLAKPGRDPSRLFVTVLTKAADRSLLAAIAKQDWKPEALVVGSRVAYQWSPDGLMKSRLWEVVARALGDGATTRNWATITKLHAFVAGKA